MSIWDSDGDLNHYYSTSQFSHHLAIQQANNIAHKTSMIKIL